MSGSDRGRRRYASGLRLIACPLLLLLFLSCAARQIPDAPPSSPLPQTYSGILQVEARAGGTPILLTAGVAVDRSRGARVEVRDPIGATQLLILIGPDEGTAVDLRMGTRSKWREAIRPFPWEPGDWWALLAGPENGSAAEWKPHTKNRLRAQWKNPLGKIRATLTREGPDKMSLEVKGPHAARLTLRLSGIREASLPADFLSEPDLDLYTLDWGTWIMEAGS